MNIKKRFSYKKALAKMEIAFNETSRYYARSQAELNLTTSKLIDTTTERDALIAVNKIIKHDLDVTRERFIMQNITDWADKKISSRMVVQHLLDLFNTVKPE